MNFRTTRACFATAAIGALAAGTLAIGTSPAAAATSSCNSTYTSSKGFIEWRGEARIPAWSNGTYLSLNCTMQQGSSGSEVKALQVSLNKCYGQSLDEDGEFGPLTRDALKRAQSREKIGVDGIYGPETRGALLWYYKPVTPGYDECSAL